MGARVINLNAYAGVWTYSMIRKTLNWRSLDQKTHFTRRDPIGGSLVTLSSIVDTTRELHHKVTKETTTK